MPELWVIIAFTNHPDTGTPVESAVGVWPGAKSVAEFALQVLYKDKKISSGRLMRVRTPNEFDKWVNGNV